MYPSYLIHYGVKGQHWGERQYQYMDGTYTPLGKERRRIGPHDNLDKRDYKKLAKLYSNPERNYKKINKILEKNKKINNLRDTKIKNYKQQMNKLNYKYRNAAYDLYNMNKGMKYRKYSEDDAINDIKEALIKKQELEENYLKDIENDLKEILKDSYDIPVKNIKGLDEDTINSLGRSILDKSFYLYQREYYV